MPEWLSSRKVMAVVVMIAGLATLVASWAIQEEGEDTRRSSEWECGSLRAEGLLARLELADSPAGFRAEIASQPEPCARQAATRMLRQDWFLVASYPFLVAALIAMLALVRFGEERELWRWLWIGAGAFLGVAAAAADGLGNWWLRRLLAGGGDADLVAAVRAATTVKWGALALSAAAAAVLWVLRPRRPASAKPGAETTRMQSLIVRAGLAFAWLVALTGAAAAAFLVWALAAGDPELIMAGGALLVAFWLGGMARAMGVAAETARTLPTGEPDEPEAVSEDCAPPAAEAPAGILFRRAYPRGLWAREWQVACERRRRAGLEPAGPRVGFGLSGGGIRSATVNLGVFQGLGDFRRLPQRLLERIDLVSSVSGGGYFGGFLGRLWNRRYIASPQEVAEVLRGEGENGRKVFRYLRENGRYLSPNGAGDLLFGGAVVLRNWVSVQLVLLASLLTVFLALQALRPAMDAAARALPAALACRFDLAGAAFWWSPWLLLPLFAFLLVAFPLGWAYWMVEPAVRALAARRRERGGRLLPTDPRWDRSEIAPLAGLLLTFVLGVLLSAGPWRPVVRVAWALVAATAVLTWIWWRLAKRAAETRARRDQGKVARAASRDKFSGGTPSAQEMERDLLLYQPAVLRQLLSVWLTTALIALAVAAALALVDSLGQSLYVALLGPDPWSGWLAGLFSALAMLAGYARRIAVLFSKKSEARPSVPVNLAAGTAAILLITFLLTCLDAASHGVAWRLSAPEGSLEWRRAQSDCVVRRAAEAEPGTAADAAAADAATADAAAADAAAAVADAGEPEPAADPCSDEELSRRGCDTAAGVAFREERDSGLTGVAAVVCLVLAVFFGQTFPFVNRSSHHALYSARLTRAYLGASNPPRWSESVTRVLPGDDCDLKRYWPPPSDKAGPIHLINVTVNETVSGRSQVEQKDRKGNNLALGPFGLSLGVEHHAVIPLGRLDPVGRAVEVYPQDDPDTGSRPFRVFEYPRRTDGLPAFQGEVMSLGSWIGVSGAAFSTGLGARTSFGLSMLAGFGNVRLGRWWDSGVDVESRRGAVEPTGLVALEQAAARLFPVQVFLLDEFLARFPGTARRHWYLSDGGHFENLGGYELIRRRLPLIVLVDAEEDAEYNFGGLSNLVRKARIDFGAEITFLDELQLGLEIDANLRSTIGTLKDLRPGEDGFSKAHAALGWVTYADEPERRSRLLYLKATVTGDEPTDVLEYRRAHPAFPHEPTSDQFFDEPQWESYRKLGEHIALKVFARPPGPGEVSPPPRWWPDEMP